jgi:hypothetical protein
MCTTTLEDAPLAGAVRLSPLIERCVADASHSKKNFSEGFFNRLAESLTVG